MKKRFWKLQSLLVIVALLSGILVPGFSAAGTGPDALAASYEVDICDANGNPVTSQISIMESEQYQLTVKLVDCSMPAGAYFKWTSETPLTASVSSDGLVRGHDSSKGAAVRLWIDNDVRTISIVGPALAKIMEGLLFNDNIDLDTMNTEEIVSVVESSMSLVSSTVAKYLVDQLRYRLNNIDTGITVTLYAEDGTPLASDSVRVLVTNSNTWYSKIIPNGAFITNKDSLPSTVAVGGNVTLEGGVTPLRLGYNVSWSLSTDSILKKASDYATLDENGKLTFLKEGTVTVTVSPNADEIVDKLLSYINEMLSLGNEVDTGTMADILVKVLGLNVSASVVKTTLDILVAVAGLGTNTADLVAAATKAIANYLLKATINDSVTFTIVDSLELKSFEIGGNTEVSEGETAQLYLTNVVPAGANSQNIVWSVADPSVAYVDENGILIGRDAGGISSLNKKTTTVTATVDGVSASVEVTVKGKLITTPVDIAISGPSTIEIGGTGTYTAKVFPERSSASIVWGLVMDDGKTIEYASSGSVSNSLATMSSNGVLTSLNGGTVQIAAKAGSLSKVTRTYSVYMGTLVSAMQIDQGDFLSVPVPLYKPYKSTTTTLTASFTPPDASNKNVAWKVLSGDLEVTPEGVVSPSKYAAAYGVVQAKSYDGGFTDTIVVSFANYPATGISLDKTEMSLTVGDTQGIGKTVAPTGTLGVGGASITNVMWTSSDESIAAVNQDGVVTAVDSGTAVITATTWDGGFTAQCTVTVHPDKTALNYAIKLIDDSGFDESSCTPEDWAALQKAYAAAVEVRDIEFAYQQTCDTAASDLIAAYDNIGAYVRVYGIQITRDGEDAPEYNSVKVSTAQSYKNQSLQLGCRLIPDNAMYASIEWSSDNSKIAVNSEGKVSPTENKAGAAKITVTAKDYTGNEVSDSVYVSFANYPVTGVKLDKTEITDALVYNTGSLTATVEPTGFIGIADASNKDVIWSSSDDTVVTVDGEGKLNYLAVGTAVITVTTEDGGFTASCTVTVSVNKTKLAEAITAVDSAALVEEEYTVDSYHALDLAYAQAMDVYNNSEATQADIDGITATLNNAFANLKKFIKTEAVTLRYDGNDAGDFISKEVSPLTPYTSNSITLDARITPLDSMYETVEWTSDTSSIAVDAGGKCTPTANKACYGTITVTVTDQRGNVVTDSVMVSFANYPVTRVDLSQTNIEASLDDAPASISAKCKHVTALITYDATIQNVLWRSSNPDIVSVDGNGQLTYKNSGQVTITATSVDGGVTADCVVTVGGDKSALREAIATCDAANINLQDHTYETSMAYQAAYEHAVAVNNGVQYTQEEIDAAASGLLEKLNALQPYIHMTQLNVYYEGSPAPDFIAIHVPTYKTYTSQIVRLTYDFAPSNAMYTSIEWASDNSDLPVSDTGKVIPAKNKACAANITLTATDHYGNKIVKSIYVSFANYPVTGVSLDKTSFVVPYGAESQTLTAAITPDKLIGGASIKDVFWTSSDEDVATVSGDGVVTFVEAGSCVITVTTRDGGHKATCTVTVNSDVTRLAELVTMVRGMNLDQTEYTEESWAALEQAMADAEAVLAIENPKQREINSKADALQSAYDKLEKYIKIQNIILTKDGVDFFGTHITKDVNVGGIYTNQSVQLGYRISPTNATYVSAVWSSSNASVEVDQNGKCKPKENKACWSLITITLTDYKGVEHKKSVYVAFATYPVTGISVNPTAITDAVVGNTSKIEYTVTPEGTLGVGAASVKDVVWSSSNTSVATVSGGTVTYHDTGSVTITATTVDGGFSASTAITVSANKSALLSEINAAKALKQTDYTPATWAELQRVLASAENVYNMQNPTQTEVNTALASLQAAVKDLERYIYVDAVSIVYNEEETRFITVPVPEDSAYITTVASLSYLVKPGNAMYTDYEWSSTGDVVVNINGAVAPSLNRACYGTVTVKLTDDFGNEYTETAFIAFTKHPVASVTLDQTNIDTYPGADSVQLTATVLDSTGAQSDIDAVVWSSSDHSIVTVDENGLVTIKSGGVATVTATTVVGGYTAQCVFNVGTDKNALNEAINKALEANYQAYDYFPETYEVFESALNHAIEVRDNPSIDQATIDNAVSDLNFAVSSLVKYNHISDVYITYNASKAPSHISTKVKLTETYTSKSIQLGAAIEDANANYVSAVWKSDDGSVTVDQNGLCKPSANKAAHAHITYTVVDHFGQTYESVVTVAFANYQVTGVSLNTSSVTLSVGGTTTLTPTIELKGVLGMGAASVQSVTFVSSNPDVVKVNGDGVVTAVNGGTAVITCYTDDGGFSASCTVNVAANKDALRDAIQKASEITGDNYTQESYAAFINALGRANEVMNNEFASGEEIETVRQALIDAQNELELRPADYSAVEKAIEAYEALDAFLYTDESYQAVKDAVLAVDETKKCTEQSEVDAMAKAIEDALANLAEDMSTKISAELNTDTVVDKANKYIYGVSEGIESLTGYVRVLNGTLAYRETANGFGTGTEIDVLDNAGEVVDTYILIVFGDVDGDGHADANDATDIWYYMSFNRELNECEFMAADINADGVVDEADGLLAERAGAFLYEVPQTREK